MNHNWSSADIFLVSDLLEEDSQFLTFDTFKKINLCDKNSLSAVPQHGMCYRKSKTQMTSAKTNTKSLLSARAFCKLQPVAKMMRHSHGKTTFLASNRSWSQVCKI